MNAAALRALRRETRAMDSLEVFFKTMTNEWVAKYAGVADVTGIGDTEVAAIKSLARGLGGLLMSLRHDDEKEPAER
jgi:hypothetical protein